MTVKIKRVRLNLFFSLFLLGLFFSIIRSFIVFGNQVFATPGEKNFSFFFVFIIGPLLAIPIVKYFFNYINSRSTILAFDEMGNLRIKRLFNQKDIVREAYTDLKIVDVKYLKSKFNSPEMKAVEKEIEHGVSSFLGGKIGFGIVVYSGKKKIYQIKNIDIDCLEQVEDFVMTINSIKTTL